MTISLFGPSCKFGMCYNVIGPFYRPLQNFQFQHPSCSERGWPQGPEILETALCVLSNPACACVCVLCKSQKNISALHVHVPSTCNLNICETTWRHSVCVCVCVCVCVSVHLKSLLSAPRDCIPGKFLEMLLLCLWWYCRYSAAPWTLCVRSTVTDGPTPCSGRTRGSACSPGLGTKSVFYCSGFWPER